MRLTIEAVLVIYLTHISARYLNGNAHQLQRDARKVFQNTKLVNDYDEFDIALMK